MIPQITKRWDGSAELHSAYDRYLVETLKDTIPHSNRGWHPNGTYWTMHPPYVGTARDLLRRWYGDVKVTDPAAQWRRPEPRPIRTTDGDYAALHLPPSAPASLILAAYRCLARELHPDHGGTHEAMLAINAALDSLKKRGAA